jgi:hypothetical protein
MTVSPHITANWPTTSGSFRAFCKKLALHAQGTDVELVAIETVEEVAHECQKRTLR